VTNGAGLPSFDPHATASSQAKAFLAAASGTKAFRYRTESFAVMLFAAVLLAVWAWCVLPRGVVVIRPVKSGMAFVDGDLAIVAMPARPVFHHPAELRGLIARRDLDRGVPLRETDVGTLYAVAKVAKQAGEALGPADVDYQPLPFQHEGIVDRALFGRTLRVSIPKNAVILNSMLAPDGGQVALRSIVPLRMLTTLDVAKPPRRAVSMVAVRRGAVLRDSDVVGIDARYDTIAAVTLANTSPRSEPGTPVALWSASKKIADAQLLAVAGKDHVIACASADLPLLTSLKDPHVVLEVR